MSNKCMKTENKTSRVLESNWFRLPVLLITLIIAVVIGVFALDNYPGGESYLYGHEYGYAHDYAGEYDSYITYGYYEDGPTYDYEGYAPHYSYIWGYIGDAPQYLEESIIIGDVHIEVDYDGNISLYPDIANYSVSIHDRYFLHLRIPVKFYPEAISLSLPEGWSYEISHQDEYLPFTCEDEIYEDSINIQRGFSARETITYTIVRIAHTWDTSNPGYSIQAAGYQGIMPLVTGAPFPVANLPANANLAQWTAALHGLIGGVAAPNRVVSVQGNQTMPDSNFYIENNRHVVITTQGTILNNTHGVNSNHMPRAAAPSAYTIFRPTTQTNRRHFIVRGGATLTLSHIILDGNATEATDNILPRINRGGILIPDAGRGHLVLARGAILQRNSWSNNTASAVDAHGGGAAAVAGGTNSSITMLTGSIVRLNRSTWGWGGAINLRHGGHLTMYGGTIEDNINTRTTGSGNGNAAGVHVGNSEPVRSSFYMHDGAIIRNNHARATLTRTNTATNLFRAGGAGVYVHQYCLFIMYGGQIYGNRLTGTREPGPGVNQFTLNGAGVLLLNSLPFTGEGRTRFYMHGGSITNNMIYETAPGAVDGILGGGGVGMFGGTFTMYDGIIAYNSSTQGGGVYLGTGGSNAEHGAIVNMHGGYIRNNRAFHGAGVGANSVVQRAAGTNNPIGQPVQSTTFNLIGGEISNNRYAAPAPNTAPPQRGGGVWIYGPDSTFNLRGVASVISIIRPRATVRFVVAV
ncbi:MAG: hypothetical protein FWC73_11180, partial [Defluviitaleaceae bacterium]|nr:hypothetical protein [Defluviitaleaceae bacterium]